MSGGVLLYVDAKLVKRNEAYGSFFSSLQRKSRSVKDLTSQTKHRSASRFIFGLRINP
jgi:hypothetical protein